MPNKDLTTQLLTELPAHQPLIAMIRAGHIESIHRGSYVILDANGNTQQTLGDATTPMFPRSALKPLQTLAMMRLGFTGPDTHIALASASHSGERIHIDTAQEILHTHGLNETHLNNTPDLPFGIAAHNAALQAGDTPTRIAQNCSGKHAAMLATAAINGYTLKGYLDPHHPLQQAIAHTIQDITGEPINDTTIDGCGAPLFHISLTALARGLGNLARTAHRDTASHEHAIYRAITNNPHYLAGNDRDTTAFMRAIPGLLCKDGAEAVHVGAFPDGRSFALKIADGGQRARTQATARILDIMGADPQNLTALLDTYGPKVLGHGSPVGAFAPLF